MSIYDDLKKLTKALQEISERKKEESKHEFESLLEIKLFENLSPEIQTFLDERERYRLATAGISIGQY